jgi:hypothetical protein
MNTNTQIKELTYVGPYKVVKIFRVSRRRQVLARNLTRDEAIQYQNKSFDYGSIDIAANKAKVIDGAIIIKNGCDASTIETAIQYLQNLLKNG